MVDGSLEALCARIEEMTGVDGTLVRKTLRSFVDSGYIKEDVTGNLSTWHWTHNRYVDRDADHAGLNPEAGSSASLISSVRVPAGALLSTPRV